MKQYYNSNKIDIKNTPGILSKHNPSSDKDVMSGSGSGSAFVAAQHCQTAVQQYCHFMQILLGVNTTDFTSSEVNLTLLRKLLYISYKLLSTNIPVSDATYDYLSALFVSIRYQPPFDADMALVEPLHFLSEYLTVSPVESDPLPARAKEWVAEILCAGSLQTTVNAIFALPVSDSTTHPI